MHRFALPCLFALLLSAAPAAAQVNSGACETPNVLLVLDRSGSMLEFNKWVQAVDAVTQMTRVFEPQIRFGLMVFPWGGDCRVQVNEAIRNPCVPGNAQAISQELLAARTAPERGNNTPIGAAITEATTYFTQLRDQNRRSFIVMITDGMETCNGNPIASAQAAYLGSEIPVFVIGFGNGVDRNTLNEMARVGGTGQAYQVNNGQDLFQVLADIADQASEEVCDGADNDCDGMIDEMVADQPCDTGCGEGRQVCVDGRYSECFGGDIPMEVCDGADNDCDHIIDEQAEVPCITLSGNPGVQECVNGEPAEDCTPSDPNREEVCDAIDNDGDGAVDEGTDEPCSVDCHEGRRACVEGAYLSCSAQPATPNGLERCNRQDDDCDGSTDEAAECPGEEICDEGVCLQRCRFNECAGGYYCGADDYCHPLP
ncbi:MAG: VWA domain-containing protein, partial [Myxococcales bacterium]|nr:VWA domain-containing protein [Myxococcales bacterium]